MPTRSSAATAQEGNDTVNGNAGDDNIRGGKGNDRVNGNEDDDDLDGGEGDDDIDGGSGTDIAIFMGFIENVVNLANGTATGHGTDNPDEHRGR